MNVLHLSSEKSWRGGEQQMAYLIKELSRIGVTTHVMARSGSAFEKWCGENGIPCSGLRFQNDFDFRSATGLKAYCRSKRFDVIHLHSSRSHGIAVLAAALGNKVPLVLSRRVDFPLKSNFLSQWKYNHPSIKKIVCVSDKIREIVSRAVKHPGRCVTVYDGIDLMRFAGKGRRGVLHKELGIQENTPLIGNIAALAPHKDYFTFLDTVKILSEKTNARFVIAGDGPLRAEIENRIRSLGLGEKIFLLGFREDLENVFAALDILLYTSKEEGLGSTLLDAMAYGLPIVATEAGGIPEIVKNGFNGLTAPVGDSAALAENVIRLLDHDVVKKTLVANARDFVKKFSKEIMTKQTRAVYKEVVGLAG